MWVVAVGVLALCLRKANDEFDERAVPLMGVMAAFIFAAQMFNFQVAGGTSGHLLGGVLAAVLLGPYAGTVVMACVIAVQALVFQDGGLVVLGANVFNMGIVGTLGGYAVYSALCRLLGGEARGRYPAAGLAAWSAVMLGALAMTIELASSGTSPLELALPAMLGVHAVIGIGEALITVAALGFIKSVRPDLLTLRGGSTRGHRVPSAQGAG
jgi:cobalt/nickel transport system permease protein